MLGCINKNSKEWQEVLAEAKNNENEAYKLWIRKGYHLDETLNQDPNLAAENTPKEPFEELIGKIKTVIAGKLESLKQKKIKDQTYITNQYTRLLANLEAAKGVEAIAIFVNDVYDGMNRASEQFDTLLKNKEGKSRHELINSLMAFHSYAAGYSILDEIARKDIEEYFNKPKSSPDQSSYGIKEQGTFTMEDKIKEAFSTRDLIKTRFKTEALPLIADFLLEQKPDLMDKGRLAEIENLFVQIYKINENPHYSEKERMNKAGRLYDRINELRGFNLDKQTLVKQLETAAKDESVIDFLFSPLISSNDSVLALFAKAVKTELETARMKDISFAREAADIKKKYDEVHGKDKDNYDKYNKNIFEVISVYNGTDSEGNPSFIEKKAFVQKYDVNAFWKAKHKFMSEIGKKPTKSYSKKKEWNKKYSKWMNENTQNKPQAEIDKIINEKITERNKGIITADEYKAWYRTVVVHYTPQGEDEKVPLLTDDGNLIYTGIMKEPSNKYINPKWKYLYNEDNTPANIDGQYHEFLLKNYQEAQEKLPDATRDKLGYILPSIMKKDMERFQTLGLKNLVKTKAEDTVFIQSKDTEFRSTGIDNEKDYHQLPIYYTQTMDIKDVTSDLLGSVMMFTSMANRYDALNNINGEINMVKTIVGDRNAPELDSKGQKQLDRIAQRYGVEKFLLKNGETYSRMHLNAFIDMVIEGKMHNEEKIMGMDAGKLTKTASSFSAVTTLAVDFLKSVANNLQGNIQLLIEAAGKEFFTPKDYINAKLFYNKNMPDFFRDFGKVSPDNLITQLMDIYDAMQGTYRDQYGKNVSGSNARKLIGMDTLFFGMHAGEHEIAATTLFSLLSAEKVKDNETGSEISVLEAYKKYGIDDIEKHTDFTDKKRREIQNRAHALNKRTQGVYNQFDGGTIRRFSLGRLAEMYRKHLVPGYKRRFKAYSADYELGADTEGYYRTFWSTFVRDLRDYKFNIIKNWGEYTTFQKIQIRKTIAELTLITSLYAIVAIIKGMGDDDDEEERKKMWAYNFMLYEAIRMRSETFQYLNPSDAYRIIKSPSAMTGTLERAIKFTDQFALTWDPEKLDFQRKTGIWNKGDNKSWAYFLKLMGYSGYNIEPSAAIQSFNSTFFKR